ARDEDEPKRRAEHEAAAARAPARQRRERTLDERAELRHDQRRRDDEEQRDRDVAQRVLRQPELLEQPRREEGEDDEARNQPRDDPQRLPAGRAAGEEDRQDGE